MVDLTGNPTVGGGDPGGEGGLVLIAPPRTIIGLDYPKEIRCIHFKELKKNPLSFDFEGMPIGIEAVGPQPDDDPYTAFKFGHNTGVMTGILVARGCQIEPVDINTWKAEFGLLGLSSDYDTRKRQAKTKAQSLFPHIKVTLWMADAILIAEYMYRKQFGELTHGKDPNKIIRRGIGVIRTVRREI